jgi:hypothetical protein
MAAVKLGSLSAGYAALVENGTVAGSRMPRPFTEVERAVLADRFTTLLDPRLDHLDLMLTGFDSTSGAVDVSGEVDPADPQLRELITWMEQDLIVAADRFADFLEVVERRRAHALVGEGAPG